MLIIDVSEVKLTGEVKQNNLLLECGQPIDGGENIMRGTPCKLSYNYPQSSANILE
jgi:hypothetical protein